MNKKNIYFKADEQLLTNITPNCFASDTVAYIEAHFDLGENWSGFDSVRAVWTNGAAVISSVLYDGACIVPWEVLTKRAEVKVNLVGSNVENGELIDRLTTCQVPALNIKCKALIEGSNTATPTPSEYEQFVQNVHEDADRAEQARDEAEQILTDTEQIKTDVENLKTQTLAIKVETESIKGDVETLKSQTQDLVDGFNDEVEEALDRISAKEDDVLYDINSAKASALGEINDKETLALAEIVNAKSSALTDISSARVTTLTEIQTEGTTQKNLVTTEGQTQVANVQTEGQIQITAIERKGAEVIASIPKLAPVITDTASGDIVSFTDGADNYPIKSLKVSLQPKQSGTGDPSPSNVRPISGWSEVKVEQRGANLFNINGERYIYGNFKSGTTFYCQSNLNYAFTIYARINGSGVQMVSVGGTQGKKSFTLSQNADAIVITQTDLNALISQNAWLMVSLTDFTQFEPYHGQSHTISFPSTVYGGSDEIVSGSGKSTMKMVDMGLLGWSTFTSSGIRFFNSGSLSDRLTGNEGFCEMFAKNNNIAVWADIQDNHFVGNANGYKNFIFRADQYSTLAEFKTAVTGKKLCYELATPTDFTTTPIEINSYKGNNTIWSDGEVECEYCADTKLYIDKLING